jgi:hypothetical protein
MEIPNQQNRPYYGVNLTSMRVIFGQSCKCGFGSTANDGTNRLMKYAIMIVAMHD